jgi:hypothetical protein
MGETSNAVSVCNLLSSRPKREAWIPSWEWELRKLGHCRQLPPEKINFRRGCAANLFMYRWKKPVDSLSRLSYSCVWREWYWWWCVFLTRWYHNVHTSVVPKTLPSSFEPTHTRLQENLFLSFQGYQQRSSVEIWLTMLLHTLQKLDNNLGGRTDKDLPLSALFSVGDCLQTIGENWHANHLCL